MLPLCFDVSLVLGAYPHGGTGLSMATSTIRKFDKNTPAMREVASASSLRSPACRWTLWRRSRSNTSRCGNCIAGGALHAGRAACLPHVRGVSRRIPQAQVSSLWTGGVGVAMMAPSQVGRCQWRTADGRAPHSACLGPPWALRSTCSLFPGSPSMSGNLTPPTKMRLLSCAARFALSAPCLPQFRASPVR